MSRSVAYIATLVWIALIASGYGLIARYKATAGGIGAIPREWPRESRLRRSPNRMTLVMFVHPKCPCTRASLAELNAIMNTAPNRPVLQVAFLRPDDVDSNWVNTDTWEMAGGIPGAERFVDEGGREAARFGAQTSGHLLVYDARGRVRFSGGITGSRGHQGMSVGRQTVESLLRGGSAAFEIHAVFGCALNQPDACSTEGRSVRHGAR